MKYYNAEINHFENEIFISGSFEGFKQFDLEKGVNFVFNLKKFIHHFFTERCSFSSLKYSPIKTVPENSNLIIQGNQDEVNFWDIRTDKIIFSIPSFKCPTKGIATQKYLMVAINNNKSSYLEM